MNHDDKYSYYKIDKLFWRWKKQDGARIVHEVSLSTDKAPPPFPDSPFAKSNAVPRPAKSPKPDPTVKMINDLLKVADSVSRFRTWLNTPVPSKPSEATKIVALKKTVPLFDYPGDSERSAQRNDAYPSEVDGAMVCRPIELLRSTQRRAQRNQSGGQAIPA
ncbi:hypothetical protein [Paraburkholderia sp. EG304]|uniref:hypothetical protein n=1 Tax=Paraburkholderia sp. EG304 TaxID=3237015 RepID=UPI00397DAB84